MSPPPSTTGLGPGVQLEFDRLSLSPSTTLEQTAYLATAVKHLSLADFERDKQTADFLELLDCVKQTLRTFVGLPTLEQGMLGPIGELQSIEHLDLNGWFHRTPGRGSELKEYYSSLGTLIGRLVTLRRLQLPPNDLDNIPGIGKPDFPWPPRLRHLEIRGSLPSNVELFQGLVESFPAKMTTLALTNMSLFELPELMRDLGKIDSNQDRTNTTIASQITDLRITYQGLVVHDSELPNLFPFNLLPLFPSTTSLSVALGFFDAPVAKRFFSTPSAARIERLGLHYARYRIAGRTDNEMLKVGPEFFEGAVSHMPQLRAVNVPKIYRTSHEREFDELHTILQDRWPQLPDRKKGVLTGTAFGLDLDG